MIELLAAGASMPIYFPVHTYDPLMKGMVIGGLGIFHVFVAQFAIGGGLLMCYFQWLAQTGRGPLQGQAARKFLDTYFKTLILISFIIGALTGVGLWFTSIQVSASTIGLMVEEFHWLWATEWTFFCLEIVAGYSFYRYSHALPDRARMALLALYTLAAWASLFWINGILSFQLTPGAWVETGRVWDGFFNATFWPSLLFRTVVAMVLGALVACVVISTMGSLDREARQGLINRAAHLMAPMLAMPLLGWWFLQAMPAAGREWVLGGSIAMTMFFLIAVGSTVLIGGYAIIGLLGLRLYINGATATLLLALAFGATAGGEFVREGVRKPYSVHQALYSNSIRPSQVALLRRIGSVTEDPYPERGGIAYPNEQIALGAKVYRFQCSVCHTPADANGLTHLAGSWMTEQKRMNIARLQHLKTFMPPFAGNAAELEALVQWLEWEYAGRPERWEVTDDPATLERIAQALIEAGVESGVKASKSMNGGGDR